VDVTHDAVGIDEDPGRRDLKAEESRHLTGAIDEHREPRSRVFYDRPEPGLALGVLSDADHVEGIDRPFPNPLPPGQLVTASSPGRENEED
jgi:hypothetical protein